MTMEEIASICRAMVRRKESRRYVSASEFVEVVAHLNARVERDRDGDFVSVETKGGTKRICCHRGLAMPRRPNTAPVKPHIRAKAKREEPAS